MGLRGIAVRAFAGVTFAGVVFATVTLSASLTIWPKALASLAAAAVLWALAMLVFGAGTSARSRPARSAPLATVSGEEVVGDELPERIAAKLDRPMTVLGVLFLVVVVGEAVVVREQFVAAFQVARWVIWAAFAGEFVVRLWAAPARGAYLRRNWWQLIFLALPFLRFVRLIRLVRLARAGRVLSSAVRSVRSATRTLTGRLGWLLSVHAIVVLSVSQLVFEFGGIRPYGEALAVTALSAVAGEPTGGSTVFARIADIALAMYAAVMFAALAGVLAAFFLERRAEISRPDGVVSPVTHQGDRT